MEPFLSSLTRPRSLMIFLNLRQDNKTKQKINSTLSLDKSQMLPIDVFPLWPRCCHNYPVLFLPKLRQDKTTILDTRLTDYTIPTLTFTTHEQSRVMPTIHPMKMMTKINKTRCRTMTIWPSQCLTPEDVACLLSTPMLFVDADPTRELSFLTN